MYDYEYETDILLFLRLLKFLHTDQPKVLEEIIRDYPTADEENMEMIMDELLFTLFADVGTYDDDGDGMTAVRFSDDRIDRLYARGCKGGGESSAFRINAWQEKIKDAFLFYVTETSYSVFDLNFHFTQASVSIDVTLSPDCYEPGIFLNSLVNMILYCQRELEYLEAAKMNELPDDACDEKEAA